VDPTSVPQALAWFEQLLGATRDHAVLFLSAEGVIVGWHGAAERLFGHRAEQAVGQSFDLIFVPEDRALDMPSHEMAVARELGRTEDDRWHQRRDGHRFWGSGVMAPLRDAQGAVAGYCKVLRDRTDVRTQLDLLRNTLEAETARHVETMNFLTTVGHELANALGPVTTALRLLEDADTVVTRRQALDIAQRQANVMRRLLEDWLAGVRGAVGAPRLELETVVLQDVVRAVVGTARPDAHAKGQALALVQPEAPIAMEADPARLHQMLQNLVGNAIKYTPPDGHISVQASVEGPDAVVRVEDDGMGISPEMLPHVFKMFTRERRDVASLPGLGVGLAAVKALADQHGGSVEARSAGRGCGTMVTLRLPLQPRGERIGA
jgi:PAS domain S-box-containing protein